MAAGGRRWVRAGLLALGLHLLGVALAGLLVRRFGGKVAQLQTAEVESVAVSALDEETARRITADIERMEEAAREEEARKEREAVQPPGQVVDVPRPREPERPQRARFAAEHDSSVEKETKRQGRQPEAGHPPGLLAMRAPEPPSPARSPQEPPAERAAPAAPATPPEAPRPLPAPVDPEGALPGERPLAMAPPPSPPASATAEEPPSPSPSGARPLALLPTSAQMAQAMAEAGTQDHLDDIDDGDQTSLNTKSWKFASFFNRVKAQVAEHWRPGVEYERRDPTGQIYGSGTWVTFLRIVLKPDGRLASVGVQQTSGLEFLDDVAVEAVKQGQPYPNPPPQLVDQSSGVISFKFGFYFDVGSGSRMKIYRYPAL